MILIVNDSIIILIYHETQQHVKSGLTIDPKTFEQHMAFLKRHFRVTSLRDLIHNCQQGRKGDGEVAITFDDGYHSNFSSAVPILEKFNFPATFFITTGYIGSSPLFMSWKQVKELSERGYEVGSHTVTHRNLAAMEKREVWREVVGSKRILEKKLGKEISLFAYPFGKEKHITEEVRDIVKQAGYDCCCSTTGWSRMSKENIQLFDLKRTPINNMTLKKFKKTLTAPNTILLLENKFFLQIRKLLLAR